VLYLNADSAQQFHIHLRLLFCSFPHTFMLPLEASAMGEGEDEAESSSSGAAAGERKDPRTIARK
jgi:hypothetical protein